MKELFLKVNILILTIKLDCETVLLEYVTGIKKSEFLFVSQNITTKIWFNILYYKEFVLVTVKHVFTPLHSTIQRLQKSSVTGLNLCIRILTMLFFVRIV